MTTPSTKPTTTIVRPFTWSYSALKGFETCPRRYYNYNVSKAVTEPETEQLRGGNALHNHFNNRIVHGAPLPLGYGQHESILAKFVAAPGTTYAEQKLAITREMQPAGYFDADVWFRGVVDACKIRDDHTGTVLDWKTGKPSPDLTQLQLMAVTLFVHMPTLQRIKAALVFLGHKTTERAEFVREDQAEIWCEILPRVKAVEQARIKHEYPAKPSGLCKKYCAVSSCEFYQKGG